MNSSQQGRERERKTEYVCVCVYCSSPQEQHPKLTQSRVFKRLQIFLYAGGEKVEGFGEGRGKRITECIMRDKNRIQQNLICEKKGGVWTLPKSNGELLKVLK